MAIKIKEVNINAPISSDILNPAIFIVMKLLKIKSKTGLVASINKKKVL